MTRRRLFVLIHRWNGLLLAGFLSVVGITGAALAWRVPLERVLAPQFFVLPQHPKRIPRLDPLVVRQHVQQAYPWAYVDVADLSSIADAPLEFALTPRFPLRAHPSDDDAFADPMTGEVLGARHYGDLRQGVVNLIPFLYQLHEGLALGGVGTLCLGLVALLWTIDSFLGLYLSFPASQRGTGCSWWERAVAWPSRFEPSWKIRWRAGGFRRLYDLHRASGVWLWLLLLVFSWSGVAFNLPAVYQTIMHLGSSRLSQSDPPAGCPVASSLSPSSDEEENWSSSLTLARHLMRTESERHHFRILAERFLSYDRATCRWTYRVRSTLDVDSIGNTQLIWAEGSAPGAVFTAPTGTSRADTFTTWIEAIHEAQIGGPLLRGLVCCAGLATALLSVTGVLIFLRKIRR